jgi:prepilin-type N-terminal cleavage/methylation domain-containing protein
MFISALKEKLSAVRKNRKGFTLIELLVVIGILAILLAIVLVAINPGRQFEQANATKRSNDVNAILNAIHQYAADNKGDLPATFSTDPDLPTLISTAAVGDATTQGGLGAAAAGFCNALIPTYMAALPVDPTIANGAPVEPADCADEDGWATGYAVSQGTDGRLRVSTTVGEALVVIR